MVTSWARNNWKSWIGIVLEWVLDELKVRVWSWGAWSLKKLQDYVKVSSIDRLPTYGFVQSYEENVIYVSLVLMKL
jgi:hypothetical protein